MPQRNYRLNVRYMPMTSPVVRRRSRFIPLAQPAGMAPRSGATKPRAAAIRGMLIATPIAAILWAPIVWGMSHLL